MTGRQAGGRHDCPCLGRRSEPSGISCGQMPAVPRVRRPRPWRAPIRPRAMARTCPSPRSPGVSGSLAAATAQVAADRVDCAVGLRVCQAGVEGGRAAAGPRRHHPLISCLSFPRAGRIGCGGTRADACGEVPQQPARGEAGDRQLDPRRAGPRLPADPGVGLEPVGRCSAAIYRTPGTFMATSATAPAGGPATAAPSRSRTPARSG
jgi:hypothetical protein